MILGLDLSSVNTGYAIMDVIPVKKRKRADILIANRSIILEEENNMLEVTLVGHGSIIPDKEMNHAEKMEYIYNEIKIILGEYPIDTVVMEDQHFASNAVTAKLLMRISGVAILAAQQCSCKIFFYQPNSIKLAFSANGHATKKLMMDTAMRLFNIDKKGFNDNMADAIGVAYTYIVRDVLV